MAESFNELFGLGTHSEDANLEGWWPLQDNAANTAVDDVSSNNRNGTLLGGDNTSDKAATGPNNYLTSALHLNGSDDSISLADDLFESDTSGTFLAFVRFDALNAQTPLFTSTTGDGTNLFRVYIPGALTTSLAIQHVNGASNDAVRTPAVLAINTWYKVVVSSSGTAWSIRIDGSGQTLTTLIGSNSGDWLGDLAAGTHLVRFGRTISTGADAGILDGLIAGYAYFSRALTDDEKAEYENGPEPVNSVDPAVSGTETVGQTLSVTTGTWVLDAPFSSGSNGTITYAYQWTRSDDALGTNEADIGSATSNTYTLQAADEGKFIRCRVRASNDGGFDAGADTNSDFTGAIQAAGGGDPEFGLIGGKLIRGGMLLRGLVG